MKNKLALIMALSISSSVLLPAPGVYAQYEYNMEANYAKYYDQGIKYYNNSKYSKAIEQFSQALKLAPNNSAVRNNLAVSYISRGIYYHNKLSKYDVAADNYREAIYYLKYDAPENSKPSPNAPGNLEIAKKNLLNAQIGMGVTDSPSYHFKKAKELRAKGDFRGSIVEYFYALEKSPPNAKAYEAIGDMYRVLQNNERAVKSYEKALSIDKNNPQLLTKIGLAYEKTGKLNSAINAFNQASTLDPKNTDALNALEKIWRDQIKHNPRNAAAHANLGTILQKKGDYNGALEEYNAAELIDPNNILVRLNLGTLYQAKGDLNTAIKAYDTILAVEPKNILAHYYKSTALKQMKNFDAAIKELNIILQIEPNNEVAKKELVEIAKEQAGNSEQLVNVLKDMADKDPTNPKLQYDAAFEAHSKGDLATAIKYYRKAIALDPDMSDAYSNLGAALMASNEYDEAMEALQKANRLDPSNEDVKKLIKELKQKQLSGKYQKALDLHKEGKVAEAIVLYKEALEADPNNPEILINLGAAYQTNKEFDLALDSYKTALKLDPNTSIVYYYIGTTYYAKNMLQEAIKNYKKAIELDENNNQVKEALKSAQEALVDTMLSDALNYYNKKNYNKSISIINNALKIDPDNALAFYYMGLVMDAKNNLKAAISNYHKATQLDPGQDGAFYALAIALDKANDKNGAKAAFQKYLQLVGNKNDAFAKYARERLKQLSQ